MKSALIFGDSFVEGVGSSAGDGWAQMLPSLVPGAKYTIDGEGGRTTDELIKCWPSGVFDLVVVQIGTNDSRFRPSLRGTEVPIKRFRKNLKTILRCARRRNLRSDVIFVGLLFVDESRTVPYKEDKIYQNVSLDEYDATISNFCDENGLGFVSLKSVPVDYSQLADGLHPSDKGHASIAKLVGEALKPRVGR